MLDPLSNSLFDSNQVSVYAVVDAANCKMLTNFIESANCLLTGGDDLKAFAPLFFRVQPNTALHAWLIEEQWGNKNFILLKSSLNMDKLQQHLTNLLYVYDSEQKPLFFRYYDPKVLDQFLSNCNADQLAAMFSNIDSYICEGESASEFLTFSVQQGKITRLVNRIT